MTSESFAKVLSANDTGATGGHQAGILVPKGNPALLAFFPPLNVSVQNPDAWIEAEDDNGRVWKLRYIYYNNKLHAENGTRNEYRLTHLTKYLREVGARVGDSLVFTATASPGRYRIAVAQAEPAASAAALTQPTLPG
ncbi:MAG: EcoRII N-terminal effector-binding domain-containing protein, partial [Nisaea sp.]|uniref:EcoRII N-terminal effector-binding domain-containing protein n=1 Tax=Nisaea sp. TaxID=2024842 RepID=UPI0032640AF9